MIDHIITANIVLAVAITLTMVILRVFASRLSAQSVYRLWLVVPLCCIAFYLPAPFTSVNFAPQTDFLVETKTPVLNTFDQGTLPISVAAGGTEKITTGQALAAPQSKGWILWLWLAGLVLMLAGYIVQHRRFLKRLKPFETVPHDTLHIVRASSLSSPAVYGLFRPTIILPQDFEQRFNPCQQAMLIAHEVNHWRAGHVHSNIITTLLLVLCWFNPLVHVAIRLYRTDQELACDASVISHHPAAEADYCRAIAIAFDRSTSTAFGCLWQEHQAVLRVRKLVQRPSASRPVTVTLCVLVTTLFCSAWSVSPGDSEISDKNQTNSPSKTVVAGNISLSANGLRVNLVGEKRTDIKIDDMGDTLGPSANKAGRTVFEGVGRFAPGQCNTGALTESSTWPLVTLRVPYGTNVRLSGLIDASTETMTKGGLSIERCSRLTADEISGNVYIGTSGSSQLDIKTLSDTARIVTSGSSRVDLETMSGKTEVFLNGGSAAKIGLNTGDTRINLSGASEAVVTDPKDARLRVSVSGTSRMLLKSGSFAQITGSVSGSSTLVSTASARDVTLDAGGNAIIDMKRPDKVSIKGSMSRVKLRD